MPAKVNRWSHHNIFLMLILEVLGLMNKNELMINSPKPNLPRNLKGFFRFDTVTTGPYSETTVTQDGKLETSL